MIKGIDYSFARPAPADIKKAGYSFVCRYLASSTGKRIMKAEADALRAAKLDIVLVFEDEANQALRGFHQGVPDATMAKAQADLLGYPADRPIYFAVDFDANPTQQAAIDDYLKGAASVLGAGRVGVYGGFYVVDRCYKNKTAQWFWQTLAWSGGKIHPVAHIYQNGQSAFNGGADVNEAKQADYGQWGGKPMANLSAHFAGRIVKGMWGRDITPAELAKYTSVDETEMMKRIIDDPMTDKEYARVTALEKAAKQSPPAPAPTGGLTPDQAAQLTNIQQIVQWIKDKLSGIFK